jgi:hypothetical protein
MRIFNRALTAAEIAFLASEHEVETPNTKGSVLSIVPSYDDWGNATLNAIDFSGNGNVGTLTNMTTGDWVADTSSGGTRALDFDGTDDYVDQGNILADLPDTQFTMVVWAKTSTSSRLAVCAWGSTSSVLPFAILEVDGANFRGNGVGAASFGKRDDGGSNLGDVGGGTANDGSWHNLVVTKTTADLYTVYLDGVQVGQTTITTGTITVDTFRIGTYHGNGTNNLLFDDAIDDVYIWDRALSLDEIKALASTRNYFDCPVVSTAITQTRLRRIITRGGTL